MRDFSEVLRELRAEKKVSQKALGEVLGVSDRNIRFYETGEHRPYFEGLLIPADYFQVSLDYLVGRSEERKSQP
jgi:transcriptional regulator with XRE-family HTH domain